MLEIRVVRSLLTAGAWAASSACNGASIIFILAAIGSPVQAAASTAAYRAKALAFLAGEGSSASAAAFNPHFSVTLIDLNGDGVPEALVTDSSPDACGSHGCSANVLDLRGPKARSIGDFISWDVKALSSKTGGWLDISIGEHKQVFRGGKYGSAKNLDGADSSTRAPLPVESSTSGAAVSSAESAPTAVVTELVNQDKGSWGTSFAEKPTAFMQRMFTDGFNRSWASAMKHNQDEPVLDGDPVTGWQSVSSVKIRSVKATQNGDTASVTADVLVIEQNTKMAKPEHLRFAMKQEHSVWKIDDIFYPTMPSIRSYFKTNYGA